MGSGRCSARSTAIARAMIASLLVRGFGLSMRQPRRECFATVFAACCASSASSGSVSRRSTIAACRRADAGTIRTSVCGNSTQSTRSQLGAAAKLDAYLDGPMMGQSAP